MILLIDGDVITYQIARGVETYIEWPQEVITVCADVREACSMVDYFIDNLVRTVGADSYKIALTQDSSKNFRKEIWPQYKESRGLVQRPITFHAIRRHLIEHHQALQEERLEADDILALLATSGSFLEPTIVSIDKDFKTVPCNIINPDRLELGLQKITKETALRNFLTQVLEGDRADGYKGCPGFGSVTAKKALEKANTPKELWTAVVESYEKKKLTEADAIQNARMAWLLQDNDYNFNTKEITIWNPSRIL